MASGSALGRNFLQGRGHPVEKGGDDPPPASDINPPSLHVINGNQRLLEEDGVELTSPFHEKPLLSSDEPLLPPNVPLRGERFGIPGVPIDEEGKLKDASDDDTSPVEQVALTVPTTDDPSMPVWTFRMWVLGLLACVVLAFVNQFFFFRTEPLRVTAIAAQIAVLPLGQLMAAVLPKGTWLNPGPFNMKEHVLITIFASVGSSSAYAIDVVAIIIAYYKRNITFLAASILVCTTQMLGYGWAGLCRKFLVEPAHMWWPQTLVSVSLFRTLHEPEPNQGLTRFRFFLLAAFVSFLYYALPGYLVMTLISLSWICWIWPHSVTAHQIGSGLHGLGLGALGLDWATVSSYLGSPLATPWFAIVNITVGFVLVMYVITPAVYWGNIYDAKTFPIFGSDLFRDNGQPYDVSEVVDDNGQLDLAAFKAYGNIRMTSFFAITYGVGFAALTATVVHVGLWHGHEMWRLAWEAAAARPDVHTRIMRRNYKDIPTWWFLVLGGVSLALAIVGVEVWREDLELPWWGVLFGAAFACAFTLPVGVIAATTNQVPGLNIITEFIMGYIMPGKPIGVMNFKVYGYISMTQALAFLIDFKLGHYMKIPPRSMFVVQVIATFVAAMVNLAVAWYQLHTIDNICNTALLPANSQWTCPAPRVFYNSSIIWGLVGPKRVFGSEGRYHAINWFFLGGAIAPLPIWALAKAFPKYKEKLRQVNMPILIGATGIMPPATAVNFTSWAAAGFIFNFLVFRYRKEWWQRYNYILSAALDTGVAFMAVFLFFAFTNNDLNLSYWGNQPDNCPYASCPTEPAVNFQVPLSTRSNEVCPVF